MKQMLLILVLFCAVLLGVTDQAWAYCDASEPCYHSALVNCHMPCCSDEEATSTEDATQASDCKCMLQENTQPTAMVSPPAPQWEYFTLNLLQPLTEVISIEHQDSVHVYWQEYPPDKRLTDLKTQRLLL